MFGFRTGVEKEWNRLLLRKFWDNMKQKQLVLEHVSKSANADINQNIPFIMYFFIIIII